MTIHLHSEEHNFDFNNSPILDRKKHLFRINICEMLYIRKKSTVNSTDDVKNLNFHLTTYCLQLGFLLLS